MENADKKDMKMKTTDGKPLVTLPKWLKPDPKAGEKGKILYIEEWGYKSRYKDRSEIVISAFLMAMGLIFPISGIYVIIIDFSLSNAIAMGLITSIPAALGFVGRFAYTESCRNRPFTIYENGFSIPYAPRNEVQRNQEHFIPWTFVESIEHCHKRIVNGFFKHWLMIHLKDSENIILHDENLTDPLKVIMILREFIPAKIDTKLNDGFLIDAPFREPPTRNPSYRTFWNFQDSTILLLPLFISALTSPILHDILIGTANPDGFFLFIFLHGIAIVFFYMVIGMCVNQGDMSPPAFQLKYIL